MSKQEMMKMQTCVLKVNIQCHCDGCKTKIKKLLQKIDGVYNAQINAEQGKVTVTGNVDPAKLINKLEKSGKHAELWGAPKGFNNFQNISNIQQFKNMQLDHGKGGGGGGKGGGGGGKDNKSQKGGKGGQQVQPQMMQQQFKGSKDMKMPHKDQKSVKFNTQDEYMDASDDDFDDDEFDDESDDEFDDEDDEEFGHGHGFAHGGHGHGHGQGPQGQGQGHHLPNKMMPMMNNVQGLHGPHGMMNGPMFHDKKGSGGGGGGGGKKGGGGGDFEIPMMMKGKGGNNDGKNGKGDKKGGGGDGKNGHSKGGSEKKDGKDKSKSKDGSKSKSGVAAFLSFGRKSKNGREENSTEKKSSNNNDHSSAGNNNHNNSSKGPKKGGAKNDGVHDSNKIKPTYHELDVNGGNGNGNGGVKNMAKMGPMRPMGNFPSVQGMPAAAAGMNGGGGHYPGMGGGNPFNQQQLQQQQYMAMMMNQQRQNGNDMFQPMMYARPYPAVNYMPPPPMPSHPMSDPYTHVFSDENTESCSIM